MNKLILVFVLSLVSVSAFAKGGDAGVGGGSDGCGLGWQVTDKKSLMATFTRATTNAFVPPTFGMTTGTIGCDKHEIAKNEMDGALYVASNRDEVMSDIAKGSGEYLSALSHVMGCSGVSSFGHVMQANYGKISGAESGSGMYREVQKVIRNDQVLSKACGV